MGRKALIIGIDEYQKAPLHGCVNDAKEIASCPCHKICVNGRDLFESETIIHKINRKTTKNMPLS